MARQCNEHVSALALDLSVKVYVPSTASQNKHTLPIAIMFGAHSALALEHLAPLCPPSHAATPTEQRVPPRPRSRPPLPLEVLDPALELGSLVAQHLVVREVVPHAQLFCGSRLHGGPLRLALVHLLLMHLIEAAQHVLVQEAQTEQDANQT